MLINVEPYTLTCFSYLVKILAVMGWELIIVYLERVCKKIVDFLNEKDYHLQTERGKSINRCKLI